ncbi:MAG: CBS domain-containing protein [Pseudonocardiaceae bacterium]|nr:CBS domain-containing protein [Pseudonocardiaceae bacterium]
MATTVAEVMTRDPQTIGADEPISAVARRMRSADIGNIVILDGARVAGIVTDRDIVIRAVADQKDHATPVRDVCSNQDLATITPDMQVDHAVGLLRDKAVRRLPVVDGDRVVGVVSIGDFADEMAAILERAG